MRERNRMLLDTTVLGGLGTSDEAPRIATGKNTLCMAFRILRSS